MNATFLKLLLSHCIVIKSHVFLGYLGQPKALAFDHLLYKKMHFMQCLKIVFPIIKLSYVFHLHLCVHVFYQVAHWVFSCNMCEKGELKSALNPRPSKPGLCSEPHPRACLYVIINPCSALSTAPNYDQRRSRRSLGCAALAMSEPGRMNWKKRGGGG